MKRMTILLAVMAAATLQLGAYDDLTIFSDEFDAAHSITNWQRIYQVEGWGNDALQQFDINLSPSLPRSVSHEQCLAAELAIQARRQRLPMDKRHGCGASLATIRK